jgi:hypothetical protein
MKALFNKIYWLIFGPIYNRLSRDVSLRVQELARVQVEFQERWAVTISDEIIALSMRAGEPGNALERSERSYSLYEVIDIAGRIQKSGDLVQLSEQLSIPLDELAALYMKYGHVNRAGIARIFELEQQVKDLGRLSTPVLAAVEKSAGLAPKQSGHMNTSPFSGTACGAALSESSAVPAAAGD